MARILIIDDDDAFREGLAETTRDLGHDVYEATNLAAGAAQLKASVYDLIILDQKLPDGDGVQFLRTLHDQNPAHTQVIMLTAYATSASTVEAMSLGAFDHLTKPVHRRDYVRILDHALRGSPAPDRAQTSGQPRQADGDIVGQAPALRETLKLIGLAAKSDVTALLTGETGSGKELFARMLHQASSRRLKPFIAVNCAAIPPDLLESELFGHLKGAFSGAIADRPGHFKSAEGGTLFLDEIGEMPLAMQAKILRVLEDRTFRPVGGSRELKSEARVIAATHRILQELVSEGQFREDLFHRLNVLPVKIPALRERQEDIPLLAQHFLQLSAGGAKSLSEDAIACLQKHTWPGNVRELRNLISRAALTVRSSRIEASDLTALLAPPADGFDLPPFLVDLNLPDALSLVERAKLTQALKKSGGNRAEAARQLGIHRQLLYAKLRDYGLE